MCTKASLPSCLIMACVVSTHSRWVSSSATLAPCRASSTAAARPLPMPSPREPAPVTMATLPASRGMNLAPLHDLAHLPEGLHAPAIGLGQRGGIDLGDRQTVGLIARDLGVGE